MSDERTIVHMSKSREVGYPSVDPSHVHGYEVVSCGDSAVAVCLGSGCRSRRLLRCWADHFGSSGGPDER